MNLTVCKVDGEALAELATLGSRFCGPGIPHPQFPDRVRAYARAREAKPRGAANRRRALGRGAADLFLTNSFGAARRRRWPRHSQVRGQLRQHGDRNKPGVQRRVPPLYPLTRAHEVDSATRWGTRPPSPIPFSLNSVRGRGDRCVGQRSDPARAAWAALRQFLFRAILFRDIPILGRTMELGRSGRMPMMMVWSPRRWSSALSYGVIANRRH